MNYYYDTEFLEGTQKTWFGKTKPTIDLISIGIVAEDGREYYAISKDFNLEEAWNRYALVWEQTSGDMRNHFPDGITKKVYWIRENVLRPIYYEMIGKDIHFHNYDQMFTYNNFKRLIKSKGKSNKQIAEEIIEFTKPQPTGKVLLSNPQITEYDNTPIELYGYYSAYDHVALCWIFGKMIDLPKVFPMYTIDLKQIMDEKVEDYSDHFSNGNESFETKLSWIKNKDNYPKQTNEHNALADARWNKKLHEFLKNI